MIMKKVWVTQSYSFSNQWSPNEWDSVYFNNIAQKMGSQNRLFSIFGVPAYVKTH
jgi:hypothetical protein